MKQRRSLGLRTGAAPGPLTGPKAYEERCISELRSAGYRITMPRVQVIRALADTSIALSAYAIHDKIISSGGKIDVVSVYRILATLQEIGLIHHVGVVDGYFPAKFSQSDGKRSQVVVCEENLNVVELEMPRAIIDAINEQAQKHNFDPTSIRLEITSSVCPKG